jgi:two-component system NtrC family sensor kinase
MPGPAASNGRANPVGSGRRRGMRQSEGAQLSQAILRCANRCLGKLEFLREVSNAVFDFCACDAIEVRLSDRDLHYRWQAEQRPKKSTQFERMKWMIDEKGRVIPVSEDGSDLETLCRDVACQCYDGTQPCFTSNGSFWTGDTWQPFVLDRGSAARPEPKRLCLGGHHRSLIVTRFIVDDRTVGLLQIKNEQPHWCGPEETEFCEEVAQTLGLAVADRRAQAALRERVKELTCLYGMARVAEQPALLLGEVLQRIVELLPAAWQYPENAAARIVLDEQAYATPGYRPSRYRQSADIVLARRRRGIVEVVYREEIPEFAIGVFLPEEKALIDAVAKQVSSIVERKEAAEEKSKLQQQLIHADRLATIGQLAAGVAHELNEPLGSVLGFAQLAKKYPALPEPVGRDIEKIINASLYAREVVKKLLLFARQVPAKTVEVNINRLVEEGLSFLESQCARANVEVRRELAGDLPEIPVDPAQVTQLLVNLVVNAVQAMPDGGTLTVRTGTRGADAFLRVEDTGVGMTPEVRQKAFLPFFTTKDVNEGTGLGLAVVHGIVNSHGGSIDVESEPGQGTRFEIRLPVRRAENTGEAHDGAPG